MIPDEAVEAAGLAWCGRADLAGWQRRHITKLLEAAAPHMLAEAWDEGCEAMHATTGGEWPLIHEDNPYRAAK